MKIAGVYIVAMVVLHIHFVSRTCAVVDINY